MQTIMSTLNPNQILQFLGKNNPQINQMMQVVQNSQNPMAMLKNQYGSNPAFQQALKIAEGKDPEQLKTFVNNMLNNNIQQ